MKRDDRRARSRRPGERGSDDNTIRSGVRTEARTSRLPIRGALDSPNGVAHRRCAGSSGSNGPLAGSRPRLSRVGLPIEPIEEFRDRRLARRRGCVCRGKRCDARMVRRLASRCWRYTRNAAPPAAGPSTRAGWEGPPSAQPSSATRRRSWRVSARLPGTAPLTQGSGWPVAWSSSRSASPSPKARHAKASTTGLPAAPTSCARPYSRCAAANPAGVLGKLVVRRQKPATFRPR